MSKEMAEDVVLPNQTGFTKPNRFTKPVSPNRLLGHIFVPVYKNNLLNEIT